MKGKFNVKLKLLPERKLITILKTLEKFLNTIPQTMAIGRSCRDFYKIRQRGIDWLGCVFANFPKCVVLSISESAKDYKDSAG